MKIALASPPFPASIADIDPAKATALLARRFKHVLYQ
jgi:hypothetical protein